MKLKKIALRGSVLLLVIAIGFLFSSCTGQIKSWSHETYRKADLGANLINTNRIALLPVIIMGYPELDSKVNSGRIPSAPYTKARSGSKEKDKNGHNTSIAYRMILSELLLSKMQSKWPNADIVSPGDVLKGLNDAGLTESYVKFNQHFPDTGINGEQIKKFGEALNCRHFLICQAIITETKSDATITIVWSFGRKSILRTVKISGQVWDAIHGKQLWAGSGTGYYRLYAYEGWPLIEEMAIKAVDSLIQNIP